MTDIEAMLRGSARSCLSSRPTGAVLRRAGPAGDDRRRAGGRRLPARAASRPADRATRCSASLPSTASARPTRAGGKVVKNVTGPRPTQTDVRLVRYAGAADRGDAEGAAAPEREDTIILRGLTAPELAPAAHWSRGEPLDATGLAHLTGELAQHLEGRSASPRADGDPLRGRARGGRGTRRGAAGALSPGRRAPSRRRGQPPALAADRRARSPRPRAGHRLADRRAALRRRRHRRRSAPTPPSTTGPAVSYVAAAGRHAACARQPGARRGRAP